MNEQTGFERLVADQIANAGVGMPPGSAIEDTITRAGGSRRLPAWLALIKESPMRTDNHLAVGSPTVRVAAILMATLLLAVALAAAGVAGQRLLAADAIVVAQDGSGDFTTINEAVAAAADGDTILIRPGRYVENVAVVGKDLTIRGDGDRDEIVVEAASAPPPVAFTRLEFSAQSRFDIVPTDQPNLSAFLLADTTAELSNLTVVGQQGGTAIPIVGEDTAPVLDGIAVRMLGLDSGPGAAVTWTEGSGGTLRDSLVEGLVATGAGAQATIERNEMPATCLAVWEQGATVVIKGNEIHGCPLEFGIDIEAVNDVLIEGNDIMVEDIPDSADLWYSAGRVAIRFDGEGSGDITIRDNEIHDSRSGIVVAVAGPTFQITGNRLRDNDMGIARVVGSPMLGENTVTGSAQIAIELRDGTPTLEGNTITGNSIGLSLTAGSAPMLTGNTICDNDTNVRLPDGTEPLDTPDNEICGDDLVK